MKCALCSTPLPDNSRYCFSCGADVADNPDEQTQRIEEDPELVTLLQDDLGGEYIIEELLQRGGMAAALDHPHIVPIHRISTTGRVLWYVMKYVDGESLAQVMQREGALQLARAAAPDPAAAHMASARSRSLPAWSFDTTVIVRAGETRNLGRIRLARSRS